MSILRSWLSSLLLLLAPTVALSAQADAIDLLVGEYNNNEQVWQQAQDGVTPVQRRHWRFQRLDDRRLGLAWGLGQDAPDKSEWVMQIEGHSATVSTSDGKATDCIYDLDWEGQNLSGEIIEDVGCAAGLPNRWQVTKDAFTAALDDWDSAEQARRVSRYQGWVALQRQRFDSAADVDDFLLMRGLSLHDEGYIVPITDQGEPTGYAIELARLTYQNTNTAILKLGIIDEASGKTLSYAWATPGADRIGINLRWIQTGMTRLKE